ncbi:MAG TPA: agmatine deiminase family protein [Candidatus Lokiarchaeia archaeon]|nr:agmatine deiminase family protein [Candidatus Lokiarchaeia archaeon]
MIESPGHVLIDGIPASLGYRMPAEFERQHAIWLAWPHNEDTFYGTDNVAEVEHVYVQSITALHSGQFIDLLVSDDNMKDRATEMLATAGVSMKKIIFHEIPTVDVWLRDYGPTFVINPATPQPLAMIKWRFTAWGGKYDDLALDDRIPWDMQERAIHVPAFDPGIVLEGGSIDVNGQGCVLTTEQCLLNPNRNPSLSRRQIEQQLMDYLNVKKVLWLNEGIAGDDTDGHVDDIARFITPNIIACAYEDDPGDENHAPLIENYQRLSRMTDGQGKRFTIVKLPMPGVVEYNGTRVPASYLNFYIGNEAVVVPVFSHENDAVAIEILQKLFPTRKVVGIECTKLVYGLGTLHCSSQQQPSIA